MEKESYEEAGRLKRRRETVLKWPKATINMVKGPEVPKPKQTLDRGRQPVEHYVMGICNIRHDRDSTVHA